MPLGLPLQHNVRVSDLLQCSCSAAAVHLLRISSVKHVLFTALSRTFIIMTAFQLQLEKLIGGAR